MTLPYSASVYWSEEDEGFIATVPEFPGLSAFGETQEIAIAEAMLALKGVIKVFEEDGIELPKPHHLPDHSGQLRLRLPRSLHNALTQQADYEGVSLNTLIVTRLSHSEGRIEAQKLMEKILAQHSASMQDALCNVEKGINSVKTIYAASFHRQAVKKPTISKALLQNTLEEGWMITSKSTYLTGGTVQ